MKKLLLCLPVLLASLCWSQTPVHYQETIPILDNSCSQAQLTATLYANWGDTIQFPEYWVLVYWPHPANAFASNTKNGGTCAAPDLLTFNHVHHSFCNTWTDLRPINPLHLTLSCTLPASNSTCYIFSIDSALWLYTPDSDN